MTDTALLDLLRRFTNLGDSNIREDIHKALRPHERETFDLLIAEARAAIAKATAEGPGR